MSTPRHPATTQLPRLVAKNYRPDADFPRKTPRLIDLKEVMKRVGMSRSWVYAAIKNKDLAFPAPIRCGRSASRWLESDIDAWIDLRVELSSGSCGEQR